MRYHNITTDDMLNGSGLRVVLWLSGCPHSCPGCHNPDTWDIDSGLPFDKEAKEELFLALAKDHISGITFSGGDPLHPVSHTDMEVLITEIKTKFPNKTIWLYTGFCFEEITNISFLKNIDILVDGKFEQALFDTTLHWKGSSNQRVIDVKPSLQQHSIVLYKG